MTVPGRKGALPARYRLVNIDEVVTSHREASGSPEPTYPAELQNRPFNERPVKSIANDPDPAILLDGGENSQSGPSTVVNLDGRLVAVGGNHRLMGTRRLSRTNPAAMERLAAELRKRADRFGIKPEEVRPGDVIVREIGEMPFEDLKRLARDMNQSVPEAYDSRSRSVTYGQNMSEKTKGVLARNIAAHFDAMEKKASFKRMLDTPAAPEIVRAMVEDGSMPANELGRLFDEGKNALTKEGKEFVTEAVVGTVIQDATVIRALTDKARNNIAAAIPHILRAQEAAPGLGAMQKIRAAADLLAKAKGKTIESYLEQPGLNGVKPNNPGKEIIRLAHKIRDGGSRIFADYIKAQVEREVKLADAESKTGGLFGGLLTPDEAAGQAAREARKRVPEFTDAARRKGGSIRTPAGEPQVQVGRISSTMEPLEATAGVSPQKEKRIGFDLSGERLSERKANPTAPKNVVNAGDVMGVDLDGEPTMSTAKPRAAAGAEPPDPPSNIPPEQAGKTAGAPQQRRILTDDVIAPSEESIKAGEPGPGGALGFLKRQAARFTNPQYTLFEKMGLTKKRIETENAMAYADRNIMERTFGEMDLRKLGDWFRENPDAIQIPRKFREQGVARGGTANLTPLERKLYRTNTAVLDEFMFGREGASEGFFRLLDETRDIKLAKGDLGPSYYPRSFRTIGDLLRLREAVGIDKVLEIINGNLDLSRESGVIPWDNPIETATYYVNQVTKALHLKPEIEQVRALVKNLEDSGRKQDAGVVREWLKYNVENALPDVDIALRDAKFEGILQEQFKAGDSFTSSGALAPKGVIEIVDQVGQAKRGKTVEPIYEIKVDGKPHAMQLNRLELLAAKYAETVMDRAPLSRIIDRTNRVSAWLTIATNTRSFIRASIGNAARVLSGSMELGDFAHGVRQAIDYGRRKVSKQTIAEWKDAGVVDNTLEALTEGGIADRAMTVADYIGFANVWLPDQLARIVSYEMGKRFYGRDTTLTPKQVQTRATHYATTVSDLMRKGARSPMSFDPAFRTFSFLSNASLREIQQLTGQVRKGQWARAAANIGIRASALYGIYRFVGDDDPKKVAKELANIIPWSWIATGRGMPAVDIPVGYVSNAASAADVVAGQPVRRSLGLKPLNAKQQSEAMRKAAPLSILRNRQAKDFIVSPGR